MFSSIRTHKEKTLCFDPKAQWVIKNVVMKEDDSCDMNKLKKKPKNKKPAREGKRGTRKGKQQKRS